MRTRMKWMKTAASVVPTRLPDRSAGSGLRRSAALGIAALLLSACGQKGALYLPAAPDAPPGPERTDARNGRIDGAATLPTAAPASAASAGEPRRAPSR